MSTIQPLLVPCTGTLADLHVTVSPSSPDFFHVYWGTALLQAIPRNKNSLLFRVVVGLLLNLQFRIGAVAKAFGVSEKPLRTWREALKNGDWSGIGGPHDGLRAQGKLRPDVEQYIRVSYRQSCAANGGRMPYRFRKQLAKRVAAIWPDQEVCEETLRRLFRDDDHAACPPEVPTAESNAPLPTSPEEAAAPDGNEAPEPSDAEKVEITTVAPAVNDNRKSAPDSAGEWSSDDEENRELSCASCHSLRHGTDRSLPDIEPNRPQLLDGTLADPCAVTISGHRRDADRDVSSAVLQSDAVNRNATPAATASLRSDEETNRELPCASSQPVAATPEHPKTESTGPSDPPVKRPPCQPCFPLLSGRQPPQPFISHHVGILLLAPEFDQAFGDLPPILRQTGAQILAGCVNQEQGKLVDYNGLERIVGKVVRNLDRQRTLLDQLAAQGAEDLVYKGNARLLALSSAAEWTLYCDTHHSAYTGCERLILGWSGQQKRPLRGIMMECFHTAQGEPCMIGHYDNFYDGRQRFLLLRQRWVERLRPWTGRFVWVHDRGYWSYDFLHQIMDFGDRFIQWEKEYRQDAWDQPHRQKGHFSMKLLGNSSRDQRQSVTGAWQEQKWEPFLNGRRFILRVNRASGQGAEVAIVTNHPTMPAEDVCRLMLSRFLQENDFSYLNRHVGINELTARKFDRYSAIAHQLQDRQVQSREYKNATQQKLALQEQLKQCLLTLDTLPAVSIATLETQRTQLRQQADRLAEQLRRFESVEPSDTALARISRKVHQLTAKFRLNGEQRLAAEERQAEEAQRRRLHQQIDQVNAQLAQVARTESRLLMLIEEQYVRPNMDRKALVDAVRITARNVFCRALKEFRPYYDNYRDDHVVLRALTHAVGIVVPHPSRIDVYLLPRLDREPEEWDRITTFLQDREERIKQRFGTRVRFLLGRSDEQMFSAVNRARNRDDGPFE